MSNQAIALSPKGTESIFILCQTRVSDHALGHMDSFTFPQMACSTLEVLIGTFIATGQTIVINQGIFQTHLLKQLLLCPCRKTPELLLLLGRLLELSSTPGWTLSKMEFFFKLEFV